MTGDSPASTTARLLRDAIEPFHAFCYFVDETKARYLELGLHPWASYFGQRAAPMGPVGSAVVTATFYGFSPRLVERSIPAVWQHLSPDEAWEDRVRSVGVILDRLTDARPDGDALERAVTIGERMLSAFVTGGRPLGTSMSAMSRPAEPLLHLWVITSALREYRGDGHVAALVAGGVGPVVSLATAGRFSNLSRRFHQRARGWSEDEWNEGVEHAVDQGWLDASGDLTADGLEMRQAIEDLSDASMLEVITAVEEDELAFFTTTTDRLSTAIVELGAFPN